MRMLTAQSAQGLSAPAPTTLNNDHMTPIGDVRGGPPVASGVRPHCPTFTLTQIAVPVPRIPRIRCYNPIHTKNYYVSTAACPLQRACATPQLDFG
jgi:hypothetical protein